MNSAQANKAYIESLGFSFQDSEEVRYIGTQRPFEHHCRFRNLNARIKIQLLEVFRITGHDQVQVHKIDSYTYKSEEG